MPTNPDPVVCTLKVRGDKYLVSKFRNNTRKHRFDGAFCQAFIPIPPNTEDPDAWCFGHWGTEWGAFNVDKLRTKRLGEMDAELSMEFVCRNSPPTVAVYEISKMLDMLTFTLSFKHTNKPLCTTYLIHAGKIATVTEV